MFLQLQIASVLWYISQSPIYLTLKRYVFEWQVGHDLSRLRCFYAALCQSHTALGSAAGKAVFHVGEASRRAAPSSDGRHVWATNLVSLDKAPQRVLVPLCFTWKSKHSMCVTSTHGARHFKLPDCTTSSMHSGKGSGFIISRRKLVTHFLVYYTFLLTLF